jgi:pyrroline-5-carboxylate reductase
LARNGIPHAEARDYIALILAGLADAAVDAPRRSFQLLAADHATPGGINEQVLAHLVERGVFETVSNALDAVMLRLKAASR